MHIIIFWLLIYHIVSYPTVLYCTVLFCITLYFILITCSNILYICFVYIIYSMSYCWKWECVSNPTEHFHIRLLTQENYLWTKCLLLSVTCLFLTNIGPHNSSTHPHLNILPWGNTYPLSSSLLHFPFICLCQTKAISYIILLSDPLLAVSNDYCLFLKSFSFH